MKIIAGTILFLSVLSVEAFELQIKRSTQVFGMERQFKLKTDLKEKVVLDCQSFIQGISIGGQEHGDFYMMEAYECESLYHRMKASFKDNQKHCVEIEEDYRSDYTCP